jgi:hypothetical protein
MVTLLSILLLVYWAYDGSVFSRSAVAALAIAAIAAAAWHMGGSGRAAAGITVAALVVTAWLFHPLVIPEARATTNVVQTFEAADKLTERLAGSYGRARILIRDDSGLPANYAEVHRLQSVGGHAATMYRPFFDFLSRDWSVDGGVNDLLNARYVLTRADLQLPLLASDVATGLRLYERPGAYSRVFLAHQYGAAPSARQAVFDVLEYGDLVQRFRVRADRAEQAVVSEIAYPGWCARVNGKPVGIEKASFHDMQTPLRAVPVSVGDNIIEFRFNPYSALLFGCG